HDDKRCTTRQGLESHCAGSGEKVENPKAVEVRCEAAGQDVEDRFADAVRGGPDRLALWRQKLPAAEPSRDDAHGLAARLARRARTGARAAGARSTRARTARPGAGGAVSGGAL